MTPKEKAQQLLDKYQYALSHLMTFEVIMVISLCIDEITEQLESFIGIHYEESPSYRYWKEVKVELERLY